MHSVTDRRTDRRTDGQQDDANSRSYCVAVRSANKNDGHGMFACGLLVDRTTGHCSPSVTRPLTGNELRN